MLGYCCFGAPARVDGADEERGVLDWNERSQRVAERHGFEVVSELENAEGRFLVMLRDA